MFRFSIRKLAGTLFSFASSHHNDTVPKKIFNRQSTALPSHERQQSKRYLRLYLDAQWEQNNSNAEPNASSSFTPRRKEDDDFTQQLFGEMEKKTLLSTMTTAKNNNRRKEKANWADEKISAETSTWRRPSWKEECKREAVREGFITSLPTMLLNHFAKRINIDQSPHTRQLLHHWVSWNPQQQVCCSIHRLWKQLHLCLQQECNTTHQRRILLRFFLVKLIYVGRIHDAIGIVEKLFLPTRNYSEQEEEKGNSSFMPIERKKEEESKHSKESEDPVSSALLLRVDELTCLLDTIQYLSKVRSTLKNREKSKTYTIPYYVHVHGSSRRRRDSTSHRIPVWQKCLEMYNALHHQWRFEKGGENKNEEGEELKWSRCRATLFSVFATQKVPWQTVLHVASAQSELHNKNPLLQQGDDLQNGNKQTNHNNSSSDAAISSLRKKRRSFREWGQLLRAMHYGDAPKAQIQKVIDTAVDADSKNLRNIHLWNAYLEFLTHQQRKKTMNDKNVNFKEREHQQKEIAQLYHEHMPRYNVAPDGNTLAYLISSFRNVGKWEESVSCYQKYAMMKKGGKVGGETNHTSSTEVNTTIVLPTQLTVMALFDALALGQQWALAEKMIPEVQQQLSGKLSPSCWKRALIAISIKGKSTVDFSSLNKTSILDQEGKPPAEDVAEVEDMEDIFF